MEETIKLDTLDTDFVSLARLIRFLQAREFSGRLHVELDQYEAEVFLHPGAQPSVWELDRATGRDAQGDAALQRLLVRSQEPGGRITIHKRSAEKLVAEELEDAVVETSEDLAGESQPPPAPVIDWEHLTSASNDLIAAVERAVQTTGKDFSEHFHAARVELGDDYPFIDPTLGDFDYKPNAIKIRQHPSVSVFVNSVAAGLGRVVTRIAAGEDTARFRERVAAELALAARKHPDALAEFTPHLDRIAGARVL
jgi:hypothetical protein